VYFPFQRNKNEVPLSLKNLLSPFEWFWYKSFSISEHRVRSQNSSSPCLAQGTLDLLHFPDGDYSSSRGALANMKISSESFLCVDFEFQCQNCSSTRKNREIVHALVTSNNKVFENVLRKKKRRPNLGPRTD